MGSNFPLPALQVQAPQQPDLVGQYGRILQLRDILQNEPLRQQLLQQQVQEGQQNLAARQALNQAYAGAMTKDANGTPTFDPDKLQQSLMSGPAAYQTPGVLKGITEFQQGKINLQKSVQDLQQQGADILGSAAYAVKAANYDPTLAHSLLDGLSASPQVNAIRSQIDNPQALRQLVDQAIANSPKQRELAAQEQTASARAQGAKTAADEFAARQNPNSPLYSPSPAAVAMGTAPGAASIQAGEVNLAGAKAKAEAAARQPFELSLARARQAIQDGDPKAAAQLLINGDVAPSQLISSRKPEFAQQAFTAAAQMSGGKWNAQSAEANFKVAQSPANVAFFGSAKSLTDPGGTLDQLAAAAKGIPQGQIPVFNTVADAAKAATGNGPIAKYAAIYLGVVDDYAKVMGGGAGSDASRALAQKLAPASASPEARAAAIEGIRGAVTSQTNSRIGNNTVMQRMYGGSGASSYRTTATGAGGHKIGSNDNGQTWYDVQTGKQVQ